MQIHIASYPRSGNKFARTILRSLFGASTATIYSERHHQAKVEREGQRDQRAAEIFAGYQFIKTHELPQTGDTAPAIYVLRDGRDACVSYAHYAMSSIPEGQPVPVWVNMLRAIITDQRYYSGWSQHVEAWTTRSAPTAVVRYEEMSADPIAALSRACRELGLELPEPTGVMPSFEELHAKNPILYRKGEIGSWKYEMPEELECLFWEKNGKTMNRVGYARAL